MANEIRVEKCFYDLRSFYGKRNPGGKMFLRSE